MHPDDRLRFWAFYGTTMLTGAAVAYRVVPDAVPPLGRFLWMTLAGLLAPCVILFCIVVVLLLMDIVEERRR